MKDNDCLFCKIAAGEIPSDTLYEDEFVGFICGILSQDHDLEQVYLDSFLTTAKLEGKDATETLDQLSAIGETFKVSFIISMSLDKEEVPAAYQDKIICAL